MEPATTAAASAAVTTSAATKIAQKAIDELFLLAKGKVAFWWKEHNNQKEIAKKLGDRLRRIDKIKTLLHTEKEVQLSSIFYPSRIVYDGAPARRVTSISDLPPSQNYIIEGTVGQGKSVFLRYLCYRQLKGLSNQIPLFLELRYLDPKKTLQQFLIEAIAALGLHVDDEFFDFYAKSGRFVLLLDAFDELPQDAVSSTVAALEMLTSRYPELQIIVTSRPNSPLHPSTSFKIIKLEPLAPSDHQQFLATLLGDTNRAKRITQDIQKGPHQVRELLNTPLLLTLLAVIYNADQTVPENEAEFYRRLFDVLLYRHDKTKLGFRRQRYTTLGEQGIRQLFEAFCFFTRQARLGVLTLEQFCESLTKAMANTGLQVDHFKYKDEIVKVACLIQEEGFSLHFIHKSVQEFYASAFILNSPEKVAIKFYTAMAGTQWQSWRQEIRFLSITDKYRFNRFFFRQQMQKLCELLDIKVSAAYELTTSPTTYERATASIDALLSRPKAIGKSRMASDALKQWRPLTSLRTQDTESEDTPETESVVHWFGPEALYTAETLERHFLMLLFEWVNRSEKKQLLEEKILAAGTMPTGSEGDVVLRMRMRDLLNLLDLNQKFAQQFQKSVDALARTWQENEALVEIYEKRVDII